MISGSGVKSSVAMTNSTATSPITWQVEVGGGGVGGRRFWCCCEMGLVKSSNSVAGVCV